MWVASGIPMGAFDLPGADAVALLRPNAYTSGTDSDDVANALTTGQLDVDIFQP